MNHRLPIRMIPSAQSALDPSFNLPTSITVYTNFASIAFYAGSKLFLENTTILLHLLLLLNAPFVRFAYFSLSTLVILVISFIYHTNLYDYADR